MLRKRRGLRPTGVTIHDEQPIEAQHSAHNKAPQRANRIRMSWYVVALIVILMAVTAVMIMLKTS